MQFSPSLIFAFRKELQYSTIMKCFCQFKMSSLSLMLTLIWQVNSLDIQQARQTQTNAVNVSLMSFRCDANRSQILRRAPPPVTSVVVATQTAAATGAFSTWYLSYPELTASIPSLKYFIEIITTL